MAARQTEFPGSCRAVRVVSVACTDENESAFSSKVETIGRDLLRGGNSVRGAVLPLSARFAH